ncbi:hypothetical protein TSAR_009295 [Trichomalopsis sarcophagae]|uniref:Reverse transcriptase domain-containing protein n=1 Tax=Trichomalopsis sarcophagae TaxID=543379 RepID=A0A232EJ83_9HYME|nr:hypothetical protein TSAR_009295 [Trichomalopsis sarcophagae]
MHAYVNGLLTNFVEVEAYLHLNFKHIVAITETKLSGHDGDAPVAVDGYDLVRYDREGRGRGGMAVYIHKSLRSRILATSDNQEGTSSEYVVLEVSSDRDKLLFSVVYRPPKVTLPHAFFDKSLYLVSDFNCNMLSATLFETKYLADLISSHALAPTPSLVTHDTINWLIIQNLTLHSRMVMTALTLHSRSLDPIPLNGKFSVAIYLVSKIRAISKITLNALVNNNVCELDDSVSLFNALIITSIDKFALLLSIVTRTQQKPWVTQPIRAEIRDRDKIAKRACMRGFSEKTLITPIPKVSPPNDVSDLCPILRLSECSKLQERILSKQLMNYFGEHDLLSPRQVGFRTGHSTQTVLLRPNITNLRHLRLLLKSAASDPEKQKFLATIAFLKGFKDKLKCLLKRGEGVRERQSEMARLRGSL